MNLFLNNTSFYLDYKSIIHAYYGKFGRHKGKYPSLTNNQSLNIYFSIFFKNQFEIILYNVTCFFLTLCLTLVPVITCTFFLLT